jgi:GNAT superfamily N-acetyltransferase
MSSKSYQADDITISATQVEDIGPIAHMLMQSWLETYVNKEYDITEEWIRSRWEDRLKPEAIKGRQQKLLNDKNNRDSALFVAKDKNGEVVGMATPYRDKEGRQQLGALYVKKDYHGKGVAGRLMKKVFEWADPNSPIYLGVAVFNERAKAFYKKWGFNEIKGSEQLHDNKIPEIIMIREGAK